MRFNHFVSSTTLALSLAASAALFGTATSAIAADTTSSQKVNEAMARHYNGYEWHTVGHRTANGVEVEDIQIKGKNGGESNAVVTTNGDFIVAGIPEGKKNIMSPVKLVLDDLFKTPPNDVDLVRATTYIVVMKSSDAGGQAEVVFDPIGRVKDIKTMHELKGAVEELNAHEVTDDFNVKRLRDYVARNYGKDAKMVSAHSIPSLKNFMTVEIQEANGKKVQVVTDNNDTFSTRVEITQDALPEPVRKAMSEMFNGDKVVAAYRRNHTYYQIQQPTPNGEMMTLLINMTGEVTSVKVKGGAEEQAITASHKQ